MLREYIICMDSTCLCLKQMNSTFCKRHKRSVGTLYVIGNFCNHSSLNCCRDFFSSIHVAENIHDCSHEQWKNQKSPKFAEQI